MLLLMVSSELTSGTCVWVHVCVNLSACMCVCVMQLCLCVSKCVYAVLCKTLFPSSCQTMCPLCHVHMLYSPSI